MSLIQDSKKEASLRIQWVNLKEMFQMLREEFCFRLDAHQIRWAVPEYAPVIKADFLWVMRMLRNLIDNALKYGGNGLCKIEIGYQESGKFHVLFVRNDDISLKEESAENIFDLFERNDL